MVGWCCVESNLSPADWCTKPRTTKDLIDSDFFYSGPSFLRQEEEEWPVQYSFRTDKLEGEIEGRKHAVCSHVVSSTYPDIVGILSTQGSSWPRIVRVMAWLLRLGIPLARRPTGPLNSDEINNASLFIVKEVQKEIEPDLTKATTVGKGKFRRLAPVKDEKGVWRVGSRLRNLVPFTLDAKMPKILPTHNRVTLLIMRWCHKFCHSGLDGTLSRFYAKGFWTVRAGHLAKGIKARCVSCRKVARLIINQPMGEFSYERLNAHVAWGFCQLDFLGPYKCRGDVNPRTTIKTWIVLIEDVNSGAVHLDIVQNYSTHAVLLTLRRFGALRGWPGIICSDPGSQLESASGKLENWWLTMGDTLRKFGSTKNFKWDISPADSPWRQGKAERRIAMVKRLLTLSIGDSRLTPVELQTVLFEVADMCNERPIGMSKPRDDGTYALITPNQLLLGRSTNVLPDDTALAEDLPMASRYRMVQHVTTVFWKKWSALVTPGLVHRQKWHVKGRNLQPNDVVMICEPTKIKAKYRLAVVDDVKISDDGCVRSATLRYSSIRTSPNGKETVQVIRVKRSVQRLCLILPVEEQSADVQVNEHEHFIQCTHSKQQ